MLFYHLVCPITTKRCAKKWNTEFSWLIYYMSIICQVHKWQNMTFHSLATFRHFEVCTQIKCFSSIIQLFLNIFLFLRMFPSICLYIPCEYLVTAEVGSQHQIPWNCSCRRFWSIWVLGPEPRSFARAENAFNPWVPFLPP